MLKNYTLLFLSIIILFNSCSGYNELVPDLQPEFIGLTESQIITAFSVLTKKDEKACSVISDPTKIPDILCRILQDAKKGSEIVFLVDNTTSMSDDIDQVKKDINKIIDCLPKDCRLSAATYGDNRGDINWFSNIDFSNDYELVKKYVNNIRLSGGGFDNPESVFDGIYKVLEVMSWKDCSAPDRIIVMGDAPPKTGSGSDHTAEQVLAKAESICPGTLFFPVIIIK